MNNVREVQRINELELKNCVSEETSWHAQYRGCAWVFVGGLATRLTEGDVLCIFSQYGEVEDIHLVRDEQTGQSKGFAFVKYEDWRSTVLAVDNFNGAEVLGRTLRVDHKLDYKPPRKKAGEDGIQEEMPVEHVPGLAYRGRSIEASGYTIEAGYNPWQRRDGERDGSGERKDRRERDRSRERTDRRGRDRSRGRKDKRERDRSRERTGRRERDRSRERTERRERSRSKARTEKRG